jgi:WD40 repeat protein
MSHKSAIETTALQVYVSALLFSPRNSLIRKLFQYEEPDFIRIVPAMDDNWSACLQTLEGHSDWVRSVAFSHDSARLASASRDRTAKIWAVNNGECLQTLKGHSDNLSSAELASILASPQTDRTAQIPQQRACVEIAVSSDKSWISIDTQNLLWLPAEYRPLCSTVSGRCVGLGTRSGRVWICRFQ